jgi:hypothetical protein
MLYINVWYVGTTSSGGPSQSYGCVWRTTVVCGALRARLAPYGCVWRPSCVCWRPTGASGALRAHLAPYGRIWRPTGAKMNAVILMIYHLTGGRAA